MSDNPDKIDFSLPRKKTKVSKISIVILGLVILLIIIGILNLLFPYILPPEGKSMNVNLTGMIAESQKDLAMKLQKNGLYGEAVEAWKDFMALDQPGNKERASIWYTIGKLHQDAGEYEAALTSYYRSEGLFVNNDLSQDLASRIQYCLEVLGKFAALRYELAERVGIGEEPKGEEIVAEIGPEKISLADLDRKIENYIDLLISQYASYLDAQALNRQKEELFKQFSTEEGKFEILNQYIVSEILYRKAREDNIADDPVTRSLLNETEKQILGQQLLNQNITQKINITENDLKMYYDANKAKYITEEGIQQSFEEVSGQVLTDLRSEKEIEAQQQLIEELRARYDVVVYPSRIQGSITGEDEN